MLTTEASLPIHAGWRLLWRMRHKARFVTVSGACGNPEQPEALYRWCGFTGNDVWHVMREK